MKRTLHLDWETRSDLDLSKTGLHVYARGKNTDIWCGCYAFNDEPVRDWLPGMKVPQEIIDHIESGGEVWAHNATFEQEICNNIAIRKYGWPYLYTEQLICTMVMSYAMGIPGNLAGAATALGVKNRKDLEGGRLMSQMCRPKSKAGEELQWHSEPEKIQRLLQYCRQDVVVEREIGHKLMRLSHYEHKVWELDQKINSRGIAIDYPSVIKAYRIVELEKARLNDEMMRVSGNNVEKCSSVAQIKKFLASYEIPTESIDKAATTELLASIELPPVCREVLELRQQASKASTAKLEAMMTGVSSQDSRLRGCFQYSGANTRRWAGRRIQLQNLKRPELKQDEIEDVFKTLQMETKQARDRILLLHGSPISVLGDCIRGFIVAAPGHEFLVSDYSAIEARVLAWLANEETVLNVFRNKEDVYKVAASSIFQMPYDKVTTEQRQVGKVAILALGYGGGVGAFQAMAKGYGVAMEPAYEALVSSASKEHFERATKMFHDSKLEISEKEFVASELTKLAWRHANPNIVSYWSDLEGAAMGAVKTPGLKTGCNASIGRGVSFILHNGFLWCRLPSGGVICYPYPEIRRIKTPWGQEKDGLTYMAESAQSYKWERQKTFGGSLSENITQAVARDLLADAMLRLEANDYPVVAHVHDEVIVERKTGQGSLTQMNQIMCASPLWALGLPIESGGWVGTRYRK